MIPKVDNSGAQVMAFHEVRGGLVSAAASVSTGSPATLIAGDADYFLDIVEITFSHNSTLAGAVVDLKNDGTIVRTVALPAGAVQLVFDAPLKQITKGTPWVIDMGDITGSTVDVAATLVKKNN
jgi:hypothetical protein